MFGVPCAFKEQMLCLQSSSLEAEPEMGILDQVIYWRSTPKKRGMSQVISCRGTK